MIFTKMEWLFLSGALFLMSCVVAPTSEPLYKTYSMYVSTANANTITDIYTQYFAPSLVGGKDIKSPEIKQQLLFHDYLAKEHSHVELVDSDSACLSVNGFDDENMPLAINLGYKRTESNWLIDAIHVEFLDSEGDFHKKAKCPPQN